MKIYVFTTILVVVLGLAAAGYYEPDDYKSFVDRRTSRVPRSTLYTHCRYQSCTIDEDCRGCCTNGGLSYCSSAITLICTAFVHSSPTSEEEGLEQLARFRRAPKSNSCNDRLCRIECKSRHPSYSGRCINGQCDCS
ncbi:hypothetical protein Zmor_025567 [Zophobas morio]|uniref:Uncharacterized protein n=1 Tax=Zophobas morio TaxID=2755281 RepID=A0AA38HS35_9CUCU|nr:hypothetical protein Zmor_025567 [Zophobas morio]